MQTRNADEVARDVQRYADRVVTIIGDTKLTNGVVDSAPCDGKRGESHDEIRTAYGYYQLPLPVAEHQAAFGRLRDIWQADGWTIVDDRTVGQDGEGVLAAKAPDHTLSVSVTSTAPPTHLLLSISSGCYRDPNAGQPS